MTSGRILHLQRLSTEDGPGIRTTVFFKGCPLACSWCHNPESLSRAPEIEWYAVRCIGCGSCVRACPNGCLRLTPEGLTIERERCKTCGKCVEACPTGAREMLGRDVTVEELLAELSKDRAYYDQSGGGVTLSGGEPTLQADFAEALLSGLKELGISTALDTCGLCSAGTFERLLPYTDLLLYDLKLMDSAEHHRFTGVSNENILKNLERIRQFMQQTGRPAALWVRTPLIPGATATETNLSAIGKYLVCSLDGAVERWELPAFNNLCRDQYVRLGKKWQFADIPLMTKEEINEFERIARRSFSRPEIVAATGASRAVD